MRYSCKPKLSLLYRAREKSTTSIIRTACSILRTVSAPQDRRNRVFFNAALPRYGLAAQRERQNRLAPPLHPAWPQGRCFPDHVQRQSCRCHAWKRRNTILRKGIAHTFERLPANDPHGVLDGFNPKQNRINKHGSSLLAKSACRYGSEHGHTPDKKYKIWVRSHMALKGKSSYTDA